MKFDSLSNSEKTDENYSDKIILPWLVSLFPVKTLQDNSSSNLACTELMFGVVKNHQRPAQQLTEELVTFSLESGEKINLLF